MNERDAMVQLIHENVAWLDRLARLIDDLDSARDRAGVVQEEPSARLAEETNRAMYVLSIVATVFLPLGFLTGLLGVNVGGIPMTRNPWGFGIVCGVLLLVGLVEFRLFRRLKWL